MSRRIGSALLFFTLTLSAIRPLTSRGDDSAPGLSAEIWQPAYPVLVRNDHGPLLRLTIQSDRNGTSLDSISFHIDGAADVDSLALFSTGEKDEFSPSNPLCDPVPAASESKLQIKHSLRAGKNVVWLSCRLKAKADLSQSVAVICTGVQSSAGQFVPKTTGQPVRHHIGIALRRHKDDGVHTYRIPALTTSASGSLLAVYDMRRRAGRDLQEDIDIGLSRSTDGGHTWESPRVIMDMGEYGGLPQEQNGCSDPGIIVDHQTREIFCFAVWMNGKPGQHQWRGDGSEPGYEIGKTAQMLVVRSKDDGLTWSKPENLTRSLKPEKWWLVAPAPQQGFQLADGTLVMPSQGRNETGEPFSTIMVSRDHGTTWKFGMPAYLGGSECQAVPLDDGSIMLNIRNDHDKFRAVFITRDFGKTWTPHSTNRNTLIEPTCNASLLRLDYVMGTEKKHVLLFANPHSQKARTHQTIQVSFDDGVTWPERYHRLLDEGRGAGYASLTRIDDKHVGIVYEGSQAHIVFEKFTIAELLRPSDSNSQDSSK